MFVLCFFFFLLTVYPTWLVTNDVVEVGDTTARAEFSFIHRV